MLLCIKGVFWFSLYGPLDDNSTWIFLYVLRGYPGYSSLCNEGYPRRGLASMELSKSVNLHLVLNPGSFLCTPLHNLLDGTVQSNISPNIALRQSPVGYLGKGRIANGGQTIIACSFLLGPNKKETQSNYFHLHMFKGFLSNKQTVLGWTCTSYSRLRLSPLFYH